MKKQEINHMAVKEVGVMVVKEGKAWGVAYADGQMTCYGWVHLSEAIIENPDYVNDILDFPCQRGLENELRKGKLVMIERLTTVAIVG